MLRRVLTVLTAVLLLAAVTAPAVSAQATEDSVTGLAEDCDPTFCAFQKLVEVDARSGPEGESPSGTARWGSRSGMLIRFFSGEVSCLAVNGNVAVIGVGEQFDRFSTLIRVEDGGSGAGEDSFEFVMRFSSGFEPINFPPDCSDFPGTTPSGLLEFRDSGVNRFGDVVVHDAVVDNTPPVLNVPSGVTANAAGSAGATVTYTATATDNVDPDPDLVCTPPSGSTFPIGTTKVTCTATDETGNKTTKTFNVVVRVPTNKDECKNNGWRNYGDLFKNQGACVSFVATGGKKS